MTSETHAELPAVAAIRDEGRAKVKVAVRDIGGILRGKLLHRNKLLGVARMDIRCRGADVNPDLAMAAVIIAGLHGVDNGLKRRAPPVSGSHPGAEPIPRAPRSLIETARIFRESAIARDWLGDSFVEPFAATREWEWRQCQDGVTDWDLKRYFEII